MGIHEGVLKITPYSKTIYQNHSAPQILHDYHHTSHNVPLDFSHKSTRWS